MRTLQIWFQNRRQNDRRRSRPLLPHEMVPRSLLLDTSDPVVATNACTHQTEEDGNEAELRSDTLELAKLCGTQEEPDEHARSSQDTVGSSSNDARVSLSASCETTPTATDSNKAQQGEVIEASFSRPGYLANRRNASFVRSGSELITEEACVNNLPDTRVPRNRSLKKSSSLIRISLTSDGNAKVLTNDDSSPSPPRSAPSTATANPSRGKLCRSHSAVELNKASTRTETESFKDITPRTAVGRSRDSRAWEFWCDSDSRNALVEKADQDAGGSAANAIGLLRSNHRNALGTNANKRNAPLLRRDSVKRLKSGTLGKAKLSRSTSEVTQAKAKESTHERSTSTYAADVELPNNESDKENWEPGQSAESSGRTVARATHHSKHGTMPRKALGESNNVPSKTSSFGVMMAEEKARHVRSMQLDAENMDPADDAEIAEFMGASKKRNDGTKALGEDLDCVQGLLSLSQGNWQ